jgi:CheY-like chemotaxis protein
MSSTNDSVLSTRTEVVLIDNDSICNLINRLIIETVAVEYGTTIYTKVIDNNLSAISYLSNIENNFVRRIIFLDIKTQDDDNFELLERQERCSSTDEIYVLSASIEKELQVKCLGYQSVRAYIEKPLTTEIFASIYFDKRVNA